MLLGKAELWGRSEVSWIDWVERAQGDVRQLEWQEHRYRGRTYRILSLPFHLDTAE